MELTEVETMAKELIKEHIPEWSFSWFNGRRAAGLCSYKKETIFLSKPFAALNSKEQIKDTLFHEIAHALTKGCGHDWRWKTKCVYLGANPSRTVSTNDIVAPKAKYVLKCPNCGAEAKFYRRPTRKRACGACCRKYNGNLYSDKYVLVPK